MTPMISVVMPVYNAEKYVAEAIESILNQTYNDFEFIIIDDCSTDDSYKIIEDYTEKDKRIKLFRNEINMRLPKTLNFGISKSSGKYIARMDADDISLPERFAKQVEFMEQNPEIGVCGTWFKLCSAYMSDAIENVLVDNSIDNESIRVEMLFKGCCVGHPTTFIRMGVFKSDNLWYDESLGGLAEDYELWVRCIKNNINFYNIPLCLLFYRRSETQSTVLFKSKIERFVSQIVNDNFQIYFGNYISESALSKFVAYKSMRKRHMTLQNAIEYLNIFKAIVGINKRYKLFDEKLLVKILMDKYYKNIIKRFFYKLFTF